MTQIAEQAAASPSVATTPRVAFPETVGGRLLSSDRIARAVDEIVDEVSRASARITDVRGPNPELLPAYEEALRRAGESKGRGLLYPYLGSGLGNGALVELGDGSVKWDMITGIGVHFFGHSHPEIVRAQVRAGLEDTTKHGNLTSNNAPYEFAEELVRLAQRNSRLRHAYLSPSGALANENALKVCYQKHAPAGRVIAFENNFMGRTVTMANITDNAAYRQGVPLTTPVDYMPFWTDAAAERAGGKTKFIDRAVAKLEAYIERYPGQHACFIFELIQGEGGFNVAPREFHEELMKVCKARGIAVWDDEIQSFGRTTEMFAYEAYGLGEYVDVFCVGKLTQVCATLFTEEYNPKPGLLSGTFLGATADFAAGVKILEMLRDGDYYGENGRIARHHAEYRRLAKALEARRPEWFPKNEHVADNVGGLGGFMKLTPFGGDKTKVMNLARACFDEGVIVFYCGHGPYHLRLLPPLGVMKLEDWPRVFECLERAMAKTAG